MQGALQPIPRRGHEGITSTASAAAVGTRAGKEECRASPDAEPLEFEPLTGIEQRLMFVDDDEFFAETKKAFHKICDLDAFARYLIETEQTSFQRFDTLWWTFRNFCLFTECLPISQRTLQRNWKEIGGEKERKPKPNNPKKKMPTSYFMRVAIKHEEDTSPVRLVA